MNTEGIVGAIFCFHVNQNFSSEFVLSRLLCIYILIPTQKLFLIWCADLLFLIWCADLSTSIEQGAKRSQSNKTANITQNSFKNCVYSGYIMTDTLASGPTVSHSCTLHVACL